MDNSTNYVTNRDISTDEQLLQRYVEANCQQSFGALYARHNEHLLAYLTRHAKGDVDLAEDLSQQTWLKVHTSHGSFRAGSKVRPWLFSIAMNAFIDHCRVSGKQNVVAFGNVYTGASANIVGDKLDYDPEDTRTESPDEAATTNETSELLMGMLDNLRDGDREAIEAVYIHGMSHTEAAEALGIPLGSLKERVRRSLTFLRCRVSDGSLPLEEVA